MQKLIYLYIIIAGILIASCSSKRDIIPRQKMETLLWDVAQSSEFLNGYIYPKHPEQNRVAVDNMMLDRVLQIHKVTRKQFNATLAYYKKRPDDLKILLDTITARQTRLQNRDSESPAPDAP